MSDIFDAFDSENSAPSQQEAVIDNPFDSAADPAAEFLAREQEELARIENDGFGSNSNDGFGDYQSSDVKQPVYEDNTVDPFGTNSAPQSDDLYSAISRVDKLVQEPEKIKRWREEQKIRLETKDAEEEVKKKEWKEVAKKELEDWYKQRQEQVVKTLENNKVNNKAAEAELLASKNDTQQGGSEWERVTKLCDFNPKANKNNKDVSRMRSMLLQLKQQPLVR